MSQEMTIFK